MWRFKLTVFLILFVATFAHTAEVRTFEKFIVLKESEKDAFITQGIGAWAGTWVIDYSAVEAIRSAYPDTFDTILFFPLRQVNSAFISGFWRTIDSALFFETRGISRNNATLTPGAGEGAALGRLYAWVSLHGFDLERAWRYSDDTVYAVLHEIGHVWNFFGYTDKEGKAQDDIIWPGEERHHPLTMHTETPLSRLSRLSRSVMGGLILRDNLDGTFILDAPWAAGEGYSSLNLYSMGLYGPNDVEPTFIVVGPNPWGPIPVQSPFPGSRLDIAIDGIIRANGERQPSVDHSKRDFRFAFVIVARKNEEVTEADLETMRKLVEKFEATWHVVTEGRASVDTHIVTKRPSLSRVWLEGDWWFDHNVDKVGVRQGESVVAVLGGTNLRDVTKVQLGGSDVKVEILGTTSSDPFAGWYDVKPVESALRVRIAADEDAVPGRRRFVLCGPSGCGTGRAGFEIFPRRQVFVRNIAHLAVGPGVSSVLLLTNPDEKPASGRVRFFDQAGNPLPVVQTGSELRFELPPLGTRAVQLSAGMFRAPGGLLMGSAEIRSQDADVRGTVLFLTDQVGIESSPTAAAVTRFWVPVVVDRQNGLDTGLAVVNRNDWPVEVRLELWKGEGFKVGDEDAIASKTIQLPARGQLAQFVSELFDLPQKFEGTIYGTSKTTVSAVAFEVRPGEMALRPAFPAALERDFGFAHFAAGAGMETELLLLNPLRTARARVEVEFRASGGVPTPVLVDGQAVDGSLQLWLEPGQVRRLKITADGFRSGWIKIHSSEAIAASLTFEGSQVGRASVVAGSPDRTYTIPVIESGLLAGLALANWEQVPVQVRIKALTGGRLVGETQIELPPRGHTAGFIRELLKAGASFESIRIEATGKVLATGLLLGRGQAATLL